MSDVMEDTAIFRAAGEADTDRLAAVLAKSLPPAAVIGLIGTLGAGKTRFVRGLASACGIAAENVVSPTFVLCQEYHGARSIYHLDAYRIGGRDEFLDLGVEEMFESEALVIIEWADRVADWLPARRLTIEIEVAGETSREYLLSAAGIDFSAALESVRWEQRPSTDFLHGE